MKRSEILSIIYDAFYDCLDIPNDSFVSNKKFDEYILNKIEQTGVVSSHLICSECNKKLNITVIQIDNCDQRIAELEDDLRSAKLKSWKKPLEKIEGLVRESIKLSDEAYYYFTNNSDKHWSREFSNKSTLFLRKDT